MLLALIAVSLAQWQDHPQVDTNRGYWRNNPNRPQLYRYTVTPGDISVDVHLTPMGQTRPGRDKIGMSSPPETAPYSYFGMIYQITVALETEIKATVEFHGQTAHDMTVT